MMEEQLLTSLQKVRDDGDETARTELNELLRKHSEARAIMAKMLVDEQALVSHLRDESIVSILDAEGEPAAAGQPPNKPALRLLAWPQQIAAALVAGAIVGLLGVGVVWAMNSPKSEAKSVPVSNGDFEDFAGPVEIGFPAQFGRWSGNPAEVIEEADGNRILRFLETGNVMDNPDGFATNCSVFQLIDLTSFRQQWDADSPDVQISLEFSAVFRRDPAPLDAELPKLHGSCRIYLFQGDAASIGENWPRVVNEAVALGKKAIYLKPGEESATISASCLLDSEATVALIAVAANTRIQSRDPIELGGYFVDDVQLTLIKQPVLPVRFVK